MEANYYDIYTSSTRIYDKISFLIDQFHVLRYCFLNNALSDYVYADLMIAH